MIALFMGCSTPKKPDAEQPATPADQTLAPPPKPVTQSLPSIGDDQWKQGLSKSGLSDRPILSRDGKKVIYISRERSLHKQRQLYEINLENKEERRLTFQDGDVFEAVVSEDDGTIYYTSTTDQIKERPVLFYPEQRTAAFPPTDIYRMRIGSDFHERMTDTPIYEGFLHIHSEAPGVSFLTASRLAGEDLQLIRTSTTKTSFETQAQKPGYFLHSFTTHHRRKWRAWIEEEKVTGVSTLMISAKGQKPVPFKTGMLEVRDIQLLESPNSSANSSVKDAAEILLTGKTQIGFVRQAYLLKLKDNCLQPFMPGDATMADLRLSNDQKTLLWTQVSGSRSQVFAAPWTAPTSNCEPVN